MNPDISDLTIPELENARVGVLGDYCLDVYWEMDDEKTEHSVETSLMTRAVRNERFSLGGAANVTVNLASLGVTSIYAIGCVGLDPYGGDLVRRLDDAGINTSSMLQIPDWHTHLFIKPYLDGREERRIDIGNYNMPTEEQARRLIDALRSILSHIDILIVNQQIIPGATIMSPYFRERLIACLKTADHLTVIVDSRDHASAFQGFCVKMNDRELRAYAADAGVEITADSSKTALALSRAWHSDLLVTRGEAETIAVWQDEVASIPAIDQMTSVVDPVGAGDTFVAACAAALACGAAIDTAVTLGNAASAVTITKIGTTGAATQEEISALVSRSSFIYSPDLAAHPECAVYNPETTIEMVRSSSAPRLARYAIFDHDGTISTLREGWEEVMKPMMIACIVGETSVSDHVRVEIEHRVDNYIDRTTGVQTLSQMAGLAELVGEFGFVDRSKIRDAAGYKEIYNNALMQRVHSRMSCISESGSGAGDFIMDGVIGFLNELAARGVILYCASGTDQEDVVRESHALGYGELFSGGIFGAVGRIDIEAKREVIKGIIENTGVESGAEIIVIGDGPVEIREGARSGAYTIGVASDEVARHGLNHRKRSRLIRAGAHCVIPDFRESDSLVNHLVSVGILDG